MSSLDGKKIASGQPLPAWLNWANCCWSDLPPTVPSIWLILIGTSGCAFLKASAAGTRGGSTHTVISPPESVCFDEAPPAELPSSPQAARRNSAAAAVVAAARRFFPRRARGDFMDKLLRKMVIRPRRDSRLDVRNCSNVRPIVPLGQSFDVIVFTCRDRARQRRHSRAVDSRTTSSGGGSVISTSA